MPPLGTREYEKGPRGNDPLTELKSELCTNLSQLVVRAWSDQYPDRPEPDSTSYHDYKIVKTPKLYRHKEAGGLMVSACVNATVTPQGKMLSGGIITQEVTHADQGFAIEEPSEALIQVINHNGKVVIRDTESNGENRLTYKGEMDMIQDALETVEEIGKLIKPSDKN